MTKMLIDISDGNIKPKEGDVIIFEKGKWVLKTHCEAFSRENELIKKVQEETKATNERVKTLEEHIKKLAIAIKEK